MEKAKEEKEVRRMVAIETREEYFGRLLDAEEIQEI